MHLITETPTDSGIQGLIQFALRRAGAEFATPSYPLRLDLAAGYAVTVQIDRKAHIQRIEDVVLEPAVRRHAAYCLHDAWARRTKEDREALFPKLKADLERLDPKFAGLPRDQGTTKTSFAETIVRLRAITAPFEHQDDAVRVERELGRAADASKNPRRLGAVEIGELFRVADVIAKTLEEAGCVFRAAHAARAPFYMAAIMHSAGQKQVERIFQAIYPAYSEQDDLLHAFVGLARLYQEQSTSAGRDHVALLFHIVLLHRSENFQVLPHSMVHEALAECPEPHHGGRALKGPARVLGKLIAAAPPGTLGFRDMDPKKIAKSLQAAGAEESRSRRS